MKTKYLGNLLYGLFDKGLNRIEKDPQKIHDRIRALLNFSKRMGIEISPENMLHMERNKIMQQYAKNPQGEISYENISREGVEKWENSIKRLLKLDPSENMQLAIVKLKNNYIKLIDPEIQTEKVQMEVLKQDISAITEIVPKTEKVEMLAVEIDPHSIWYFSSTEKVGKVAVGKNPYQIINIKDPSKEICEEALKTLFGNIFVRTDTQDFIENTINLFNQLQIADIYEINFKYEFKHTPSEKEISQLNSELKVTAMLINEIWPAIFRDALEHKDLIPSEEFKLFAIKADSHLIRLIDNPSTNIQLAAINEDPLSITYLKNPSEDIQLAAIRLNPFCVGKINNLTDKAAAEAREYISRKFEALSANPENIESIDNPSKEMLGVVHKNDPYDFIWLINKEFILAVKNRDFNKIVQLKEEGYQPSTEAMQIISEVTPENDVVAIQKIYGTNTTNNLEDIKLTNSCSNEKKIDQPLITNSLMCI